jgi:hypothetical protein
MKITRLTATRQGSARERLAVLRSAICYQAQRCDMRNWCAKLPGALALPCRVAVKLSKTCTSC